MPVSLHSINAMRVLAEFWVIRFHCLDYRGPPSRNNMGPVGEDIMCFFFVLSGFVLMYRHEKTEFTSWESKRDFVLSRVKRVYPPFLLNYLFSLPFQVMIRLPAVEYCWAKYLCSALQLVMLDGWAGCGAAFTVLCVAWYLSCIIWLWLVFPFFKDFIVDYVYAGQRIWLKMGLISLLWSALMLALRGYDVQTLAGVPVLRLGEFLVGCGAALAMQHETPACLAGNLFWFPFICTIMIYILQETPHGQSWVCLREHIQHEECTLWHPVQKQFDGIEPPCITWAEKIPNKYAFIFAATLHGLARAELKGDKTVWFLGILRAQFFRAVGSFSLILYLSHMNMAAAIRWIFSTVLRWNPAEVHDDILLFWIYITCYLLNLAMTRLLVPLKNSPAAEETGFLIVNQLDETASAFIGEEPAIKSGDECENCA